MIWSPLTDVRPCHYKMKCIHHRHSHSNIAIAGHLILYLAVLRQLTSWERGGEALWSAAQHQRKWESSQIIQVLRPNQPYTLTNTDRSSREKTSQRWAIDSTQHSTELLEETVENERLDKHGNIYIYLDYTIIFLTGNVSNNFDLTSQLVLKIIVI